MDDQHEMNEFNRCVSYIQKNPGLGRLAYRTALGRMHRPCDEGIEVTLENVHTLEVRPAHYIIGNDNISVQYDSLIELDDLFEIWMPNECEPRRYMTKKEVKNLLIQWLNRETQ